MQEKDLLQKAMQQKNMMVLYRDEFVPEEETQFAAMTFLLPDGTAFVAFRGTDRSLVGWKEDFNMVPLSLLSNRPDVQQAEYSLAQAFYATNGARSAFYPNITLSGVTGWTNNGTGMITNPGGWLLQAIGSLTQPLFNKGANIAQLKIAKAQQEEASLAFQQSLLNAGSEVNNALTQWQTARGRITLADRQIASLQKAVKSTQLLMDHGNITYLEVLTAQQSLLQAELSQAADRFDEIQGVINLYHALGGGQEE